MHPASRVKGVWLAPLLLLGGCGGSKTTGMPDLAMEGPADAAVGPDLAPSPPDLSPLTLTVTAPTNLLALDACQVTPALVSDLPAGTYTITLAASTLSKGGVTGTSPPVPSVDNYVIVQLPLVANDAQQARRFFMLNGIGAYATFTLSTMGTVQVMFIDSDGDSNVGDATISVEPGGYMTNVNAATNVLRWKQGCNSTPVSVDIAPGNHTVKLASSTLSPAPGAMGDYVILRMPSEAPQDDRRYVMLNGVDATLMFAATATLPLRAWYLSATGAATGQGTLGFTDP